LCAVHERKLPPETQLKTALPTIFGVDPIILGFESLDGWGSLSKDALHLNDVDPKEGGHCLQIDGGGYVRIESRPFPHIQNISNIILSIKQPNPGLNPWWSGQAQLFIESSSLGLFNQWIGEVSLTPLPKGSWTDISFPMPEWLKEKFSLGAQDVSIRIVINSPKNSTSYFLDNLRLYSN